MRCRRRSKSTTGPRRSIKAEIRLDTPMLYAMGWIGLFVIGGVTGLMLASTSLDGHVHDTYFVVAHFHYIMVGATVVAFLGGIHFWWPKITGRLYSESWGRVSALLMFIGFNMTFFAAICPGLYGHAAALPCLSASIPGAQRAFLRRGDGAGGGLHLSDDLSRSGRFGTGRRPATIHGARRDWSGPPPRRRRSTISTTRRSSTSTLTTIPT